MEVDAENLREMGDSLATLRCLLKEIDYTLHLLQPIRYSSGMICDSPLPSPHILELEILMVDEVFAVGDAQFRRNPSDDEGGRDGGRTEA